MPPNGDAPKYGFDIVAGWIRRDAMASPLLKSVAVGGEEKAIKGATSHVTRLVNSSFQPSAGRKRKDTSPADEPSAIANKRRAPSKKRAPSTITPSPPNKAKSTKAAASTKPKPSSSNKAAPSKKKVTPKRLRRAVSATPLIRPDSTPSSHSAISSNDTDATNSPVSRFNSTFAVDDDIAPLHDDKQQKSQNQYYKRLLPCQTVRSAVGDEIILVVPPLQKGSSDLVIASHTATMKEINAVLLNSCHGLLGEDRKEQLKRIHNTHKISRET